MSLCYLSKAKKITEFVSSTSLLPSYENFHLYLKELSSTIGYLTIDFSEHR